MKPQHPVPDYSAADFERGPFIVFYEATRACDLACKHCRASAMPRPHPKELTGKQSRELLDQLASFEKKPLLVFTGGDPLKRADLFELISYARTAGLSVAVTPSATPLVTRPAIERMYNCGASRMAISLDAVDAQTHDAFRCVEGSFERTLEIMDDVSSVGMPLQVNTTVTRGNVNQLLEMADMLEARGVVLWSVFFLVPVGRGLREQRISAQEYEEVFEQLWHIAQTKPFAVKTTEAHHYRRFVMQKKGNPLAGGQPGQGQRAPLGVNDGKGVMFISHTGQVHPSGFMPVRCGSFPEESVVDIYQNDPTFRALRDPDRFHGKCGVCEFRKVCGGSRARAYAVHRDIIASEPDCVYIPRNWDVEKQQRINADSPLAAMPS